ncbi:hypothetical protein GYA19_04315 [Candidatus Beckwithbacteria bacterium]|nr:hypothetical protein [Candidatus Beckwithbacteria bacterium]
MMQEIFIGVPFHENENRKVFSRCVANLSTCLAGLDSDISAQIFFIVNGPETNQRRLRSYGNNDPRIRIMHLPDANRAASVSHFANYINEQGYSPAIFITDADIYREPDCLLKMQEAKGNGTVLVATQHRVYPLDWLKNQVKLSEEEKFWYQVFEGDKDPRILPILETFGFSGLDINKMKIKESLVLVDTNIAIGMHGKYHQASESLISRAIPREKIAIADTWFYHMGRVSLKDHVIARLRHFYSAKIEGFLEEMYQSEILSESPEELNLIAETIVRKVSIEAAEFFLLRCALRNLVARYCIDFVSNNLPYDQSLTFYPSRAITYKDAEAIVNHNLKNLILSKSEQVVAMGNGITQVELPRYAIDPK